MTLGASRTAAQRDERNRSEQQSAERKRSDQSSAGPDGRGSEEALGADDRPELVDATHYDFDRLERAITGLVSQQRTLLAENEMLRQKLGDRDAEVERLENELRAAIGRRKNALERIDALIDELDRLDARLDDAMANWVEQPGDAPPEPGDVSQ